MVTGNLNLKLGANKNYALEYFLIINQYLKSMFSYFLESPTTGGANAATAGSAEGILLIFLTVHYTFLNPVYFPFPNSTQYFP